MSLWEILEIFLFFIILFFSSFFVGWYMTEVLSGRKFFLLKPIELLEKGILKLFGPSFFQEKQTWKQYSLSIILLNAIVFLISFLVLRFQNFFNLNFEYQIPLSWDLAFNVCASFISGTNWQPYHPEVIFNYFSQTFVLSTLGFIAAITAWAATIAIIRGIASLGEGNFWNDFLKCAFYFYLPASFILSLFFISQGAIQNFLAPLFISSLEGNSILIPEGPVASRVAIKVLGTNGGGFFSENSAHPFDNPTALTNLVQTFFCVLVPSSLLFMYGIFIKNLKHTITLWVMIICFLFGYIYLLASWEGHQSIYKFLPGMTNSQMNFDGKEMRFGVFGSAFFTSIATTVAGMTNSIQLAFTDHSFILIFFNIMLDGIVFKSTGHGLYTSITYIMIVVLVLSLMTGKNPDYLGKRIGTTEFKIVIAQALLSAVVLFLTTLTSLSNEPILMFGKGVELNSTQVFYTIMSSVNNNGSSINLIPEMTSFWNYTTGILMLFGRYSNMFLMILLAYFFSQRRKTSHVKAFEEASTSGLVYILVFLTVVIFKDFFSFIPIILIGPILDYIKIG